MTALDLWAQAWEQETAEAMKWTEAPVELWRTGGRKTKALPYGEDLGWWHEQGPIQLERYETWLRSCVNQGWQVATLPDGSPGVEHGFEVEFGGVAVRGYIDLILERLPGGLDGGVLPSELLVVDVKSGQPPKSDIQLGLYGKAIEKKFGVPVDFGAYYITRNGEATPPVSLERFTEDFFVDLFAKTDRIIREGLFLPNISNLCASCSVNDYCAAYGGSLVSELPNVSFERIVT